MNDAWDALRQLRLSGKRPALPVIITTKPYLPARLDGVGCMTILHEAGKPMPVKLLEDLDVIFYFDTCELVTHVEHLARERGVKFGRWVRAYCSCMGGLTIAPMLCASHKAAMEWLEPKNAA